MDRILHDEARRSLQEQWSRLEDEEQRLVDEKNTVSKEWVGLERKHIHHQGKREEFENVIADLVLFLPATEVIKINVGGQIFTSTVQVWTRDRFSILARLCIASPLIEKDASGCFFFDRDWWIFRYVFLFLRDKTLPETLDELRELYYEASFYRLMILQHAIEAQLLKEGEDPEIIRGSRVKEERTWERPSDYPQVRIERPGGMPIRSERTSSYPLWSDGRKDRISFLRKSVSASSQGPKTNTNFGTKNTNPTQHYFNERSRPTFPIDRSLPDPFGFTNSPTRFQY